MQNASRHVVQIALDKLAEAMGETPATPLVRAVARRVPDLARLQPHERDAEGGRLGEEVRAAGAGEVLGATVAKLVRAL